MKRDYIEFQDRSVPLAYLITFRCYGTWLHGDERGSVGRRSGNIYGEPKIKPNETLRRVDDEQFTKQAMMLGPAERSVIDRAIREVCSVRVYNLFALNIRTNHVHLVVSNGGKVEQMMNSFKAYSTRALRAAKLISLETKPWSRHGSTRYLWSDEHIEIAVDYVVKGQGGDVPKFE